MNTLKEFSLKEASLRSNIKAMFSPNHYKPALQHVNPNVDLYYKTFRLKEIDSVVEKKSKVDSEAKSLDLADTCNDDVNGNNTHLCKKQYKDWTLDFTADE